MNPKLRNLFLHGSGKAKPPARTQHWYRIANEGDTISNVTGNIRFGTGRMWSPVQNVTNATIVATSANFGSTYNPNLWKQLQCDSEEYSARHLKIMPLGDSITANDTTNSGWRLLMQQMPEWTALAKQPLDFVGNNSITYNNIANLDFDHNGYSGYRATDLNIPAGSGTGPGWPNSPPYYSDARDLDDWFVGTAANIVILHMGTNDLAAADSSVSNTSILNGYKAMLDRARVQNPSVHLFVSQIIGMGTQWPGGDARVQSLNAQIPGWAAANSTPQSPITVVDQYTGFDPATMTADGIHPNPTGGQQMATVFFNALQPYIKFSPLIHSYNTAKFSYWYSSYPFINISKLVDGGWWGNKQNGQPFTVDADAFPTNIDPGDWAITNPVFALDDNHGYFPPGDYEVTCVPPTAYVAVTNTSGQPGPYLTNIVPGYGRATFTALDAGTSGWSNFSLSLRFGNDTGGTIHLTNVVCCKVSERSLLDAGQITRPAWRAAYQGCNTIRFFDWEGLNAEIGDYYRWFSDIRNTESRHGYWAGGSMYLGPCPVVVMAKVALEVGAKAVHINLPIGDRYNRFKIDLTAGTVAMLAQTAMNNYDKPPPDGTGHGADDVAAPPTPHGLKENERVWIDGPLTNITTIHSQTIYYVHVVDALHFQLRLTSGGAIIVFTESNNGSGWSIPVNIATPATLNYPFIGSLDINPVADYYTPYAQAWKDAAPGLTYYVTSANEHWNYQVPQSWDPGLGSHIAAGLTNARGAAQGWLMLQCWKAFEAVFPAGQVIRMVENQSSYPQNSWSGFWDYVDPGFITAGQTVSQILAATLSRSRYSHAPYFYFDKVYQSATGDVIWPDSAWNAGYTDGMVPDSYYDSQIKPGMDFVQYQMQVSHDFAQSKVPGLQMCSYECGMCASFGFSQHSNHGYQFKFDVIEHFKNWLDGPGGAAMYSQMIQLFKNFGFTTMTHLTGPYGRVENWSGGQYNYEYYGIKDERDGNVSQRHELWKQY
jgi:hypothetical protein